MVETRSGRSPRRLMMAAVVSVLLISPAAAAEGEPGAPQEKVDVAEFSTRARAWTLASFAQRADSLARAETLARDVKEAEDIARRQEERRLADLEARRRAAIAAAATSTTTIAPTTLAPSTTLPPATTLAPPTTGDQAAVPTSSIAAPESEPDPVVTESTPTTTTEPATAIGPSAGQWEALRACESGGRYDAISRNGRYRGAYQFSQATWDWVARTANPALLGLDPAAAAPVDQDAQALSLWTLRGSSPWPTCGVHLN